MAQMINTVTGPITPDQLGKTRIHEHFVFAWPGTFSDISRWGPLDVDGLTAHGVDIAKRLVDRGYKTAVDVTPNDCGRSPDILKAISEQSGLQIICATGCYHNAAAALEYWRFLAQFGPVVDEIEDLLLTEITQGIENTGVKAGVIKVATSNHFDETSAWFMEAAVRVQQKTGVPIITHTAEGDKAFEQAQQLKAYGANPAKTMIGHMCAVADIAYQEKVLNLGFNIGFDRIGHWGNMPGDDFRIKSLTQVLANNWAGRVMLSSDFLGTVLGRQIGSIPERQKEWGDTMITHLDDNFIPMMKKHGITDQQISLMLNDNPKNFFS